MQRQQLIILFFSVLSATIFGQDITLYQQYNGRIDYTAIGNTLNEFENNIVVDSVKPYLVLMPI